MFYQYNPNEVTVVHGSILCEGFADGSMVLVTAREGDFEMEPGSQADVVMRRLQNPIGEIRIRLQAESPTNTALAQLRARNRRLPRPIPQKTIVRDLGKVAKHSSAFSIIQGPPDADYGNEAGVREWVFLCADLDTFVAGAIQVN